MPGWAAVKVMNLIGLGHCGTAMGIPHAKYADTILSRIFITMRITGQMGIGVAEGAQLPGDQQKCKEVLP